MADLTKCTWCPATFEPKDGKKFCSDTCRNAHNGAARKWGLHAANTDLVPVDTLKRFVGTQQPCTASEGVE